MHYFLTDTAFASIKTDQKKRTFTGIANSGKPFVYQGVRAIADLSDISFADKVPVLLLHDRDKRVGVGVLAVIDNQLTITGDLLDNEQGQTLATESDAGFPFQMSAHIIADYEERLTHGQTAVVNGQTVTGEITILRKCRVSEVSFTPTGVDNQTMAMILSQTHNQKENAMSNPNPPQKSGTIDEAVLARMTELTNQVQELTEQVQELTKERDEIKAQKAKADEQAKTAEIEAQLSQKGFTKDNKGDWQGIESSTVEVLLSLDVDKAKTVIGSLSAPKKSVPEVLLSEQYGTNSQTSDTTNPLLENARSRKS